MTRLRPAPPPPVGLAVASFVLGFIGLLFFIFPVLGIPISIVGLGAGLVGVFVTCRGVPGSFRWSIAGVVLSGIALIVGVSIGLAPSGIIQSRPPPPWQPVPGRPYAPPPARPAWWDVQTPETGRRSPVAP